MANSNVPDWTHERTVRLQCWHERLGQMSSDRWARTVAMSLILEQCGCALSVASHKDGAAASS